MAAAAAALLCPAGWGDGLDAARRVLGRQPWLPWLVAGALGLAIRGLLAARDAILTLVVPVLAAGAPLVPWLLPALCFGAAFALWPLYRWPEVRPPLLWLLWAYAAAASVAVTAAAHHGSRDTPAQPLLGLVNTPVVLGVLLGPVGRGRIWVLYRLVLPAVLLPQVLALCVFWT